MVISNTLYGNLLEYGSFADFSPIFADSARRSRLKRTEWWPELVGVLKNSKSRHCEQGTRRTAGGRLWPDLLTSFF
jgi:hypothetical protein